MSKGYEGGEVSFLQETEKMGWYFIDIVFVGSKKCGILNVLWCLAMVCGFKTHTKIWLNSPFEITAKKRLQLIMSNFLFSGVIRFFGW